MDNFNIKDSIEELQNKFNEIKEMGVLERDQGVYIGGYKHKNNVEYFLKIFRLIIFIQALFILLMFINENFKEFIYSILKNQDELIVLNKNTLGVRGFGIGIDLLSFLGVFQSIGCFISIFLISKFNSIFYTTFLNIFLSVIFISNI